MTTYILFLNNWPTAVLQGSEEFCQEQKRIIMEEQYQCSHKEFNFSREYEASVHHWTMHKPALVKRQENLDD